MTFLLSTICGVLCGALLSAALLWRRSEMYRQESERLRAFANSAVEADVEPDTALYDELVEQLQALTARAAHVDQVNGGADHCLTQLEQILKGYEEITRTQQAQLHAREAPAPAASPQPRYLSH